MYRLRPNQSCSCGLEEIKCTVSETSKEHEEKKKATLEHNSHCVSSAPEPCHVFGVVQETVPSSGTHAQMNSIIVQNDPPRVWNPLPSTPPFFISSPYLTPSSRPSAPLGPARPTPHSFPPNGSNRLYGCLHGNHSVNNDQCCMLWLWLQQRSTETERKGKRWKKLRMFWVRCNDRGTEKKFILKCEYLFFPEWLSIAMKFFILYLRFPSPDPAVFIICGCFIAQYLYVVVVLTSVMGWVCPDKLFDHRRWLGIVRAAEYR